MSDQVAVRRPEEDELGRVREVARSSLTASYALSPAEIDTITEQVFAEGALTERLEDDSETVLVAETEDVLAGVAVCEGAEVDWLEVDPERRGLGVGSTLFEHVRDEVADASGPVRAATLASSTEPGRFFERFDFERVEKRQRTVGDLEAVEYLYGPADADLQADEQGGGTEGSATREADTAVEPADRDDLDLPDEVETEDGTVVLGPESVPGSEGGFVATYTDGRTDDRHGFYCVNCGSTDVTVDSADRVRCSDCGNEHRPEEYDASYL